MAGTRAPGGARRVLGRRSGRRALGGPHQALPEQPQRRHRVSGVVLVPHLRALITEVPRERHRRRAAPSTRDFLCLRQRPVAAQGPAAGGRQSQHLSGPRRQDIIAPPAVWPVGPPVDVRPGGARRVLEQQSGQRALGEPQQEQPEQPQRQHRVSGVVLVPHLSASSRARCLPVPRGWFGSDEELCRFRSCPPTTVRGPRRGGKDGAGRSRPHGPGSRAAGHIPNRGAGRTRSPGALPITRRVRCADRSRHEAIPMVRTADPTWQARTRP